MYHGFMAAPMTHIILTEKVFEKYFLKMNKKDFVVGTSFPDIRSLGVIERSKTHLPDHSLQDIWASDSFMAGVRFHALVDAVRERYMGENGIYALFPGSLYLTQTVKRFEDEVLKSRINNWEEIAGYFDSVYEDERRFGIDEKDIIRWHQLIARYCNSSLDAEETTKRFVADIGMPEIMYEEMKKTMGEVTDEKKAREIVEGFYEKFEELVV